MGAWAERGGRWARSAVIGRSANKGDEAIWHGVVKAGRMVSLLLEGGLMYDIIDSHITSVGGAAGFHVPRCSSALRSVQ